MEPNSLRGIKRKPTNNIPLEDKRTRELAINNVYKAEVLAQQ